jgi:hypothetical protein
MRASSTSGIFPGETTTMGERTKPVRGLIQTIGRIGFGSFAAGSLHPVDNLSYRRLPNLAPVG